MKAPTLKQFNFAADLINTVYDSSDVWHYFVVYHNYNSKGQAHKQGTIKEWSQFIDHLLTEKESC